VERLLDLTGVVRYLGGREVLSDVDLQVHQGSRLALVGENGCGKSTILNLCMGLIDPDGGSIERSPGMRTRYHPQAFPQGDGKVIDVLSRPHPFSGEMLRARADISRMEASGDYSEAYWEATSTIERLERPDKRALHRARENLAELSPEADLLDREIGSLSGGERAKVALARTMAGCDQLDLLMLDEATNHLDIHGLQVLESTLTRIPAAVIMVSHDRAFMDAVATRVAELESGTITVYNGNYSAYRLEADRRYTREEKEARLLFHERKRLKESLSGAKARNPYTKTVAQLTSRIDRMQEGSGPRKKKGMRLILPGGELDENDAFKLEKVSKSFDGHELFHSGDILVRRGDHVGLVGWNGSGKTTLLKMLNGEDDDFQGTIGYPEGARIGVFRQEDLGDMVEGTLFEALQETRPDLTERQVLGQLARFGLKGNVTEQDVSTLSGGERQRLQLVRLVLSPADILLLDEPTNHLDLESKEAVEAALQDFPGTIISVSHDRTFLDRFCTKVLSIHEGVLSLAVGNYSDVMGLTFRRKYTGRGLYEGPKVTYTIIKGFTDWETRTKYRTGDIVHLSEEDLPRFKAAFERGCLKKK